MKKLFFLAIMAVLFSLSLQAQQDFTGPIMPQNEEAHYQMSAPVEDMAYRFSESRPCYCMPCPPCPEPVVKKPVTKKTASSGSGISIENNPNICIDIQLPGCTTHCQQAPPPAVKNGSGWGWPWGWNPNWLWWFLLLIIGLPLWIMALRNNSSQNRQNPPASIPPSPPAKKEFTPDMSLAQKALSIASEKGSSFKYFPDGGFKVDFFPPATPPAPTTPLVKRDQTVAPGDA